MRNLFAPYRTLRTCSLRACLGLAVMASSAGVLLGCAGDYGQQAYQSPPRKSLALRDRVLLRRLGEPDCSVKVSQGISQAPKQVASNVTHGQSASPSRSDAASPETGGAPSDMRPIAQSNGSLVDRVKLEYERDCYKRAEQRARHTLFRLQQAVESRQ